MVVVVGLFTLSFLSKFFCGILLRGFDYQEHPEQLVRTVMISVGDNNSRWGARESSERSPKLTKLSRQVTLTVLLL